MLDADGNLLSANGSSDSAYTVAVQDSDVSSISVYLCDYDEYMDELKGYYFSADYQEKAKTKTFKQLLDEHAVASDTKIITALSNLNKSKIKPRYFQFPALKVPGFLLYAYGIRLGMKTYYLTSQRLHFFCIFRCCIFSRFIIHQPVRCSKKCKFWGNLLIKIF